MTNYLVTTLDISLYFSKQTLISIAGISNSFVVYKQCVHLPAAWHTAKELRSADHSHLMVGQSSNNSIHTVHTYTRKQKLFRH